MFNLSRHDAKFIEPEFYVDPLDERFTGINNEILPAIIGIGSALIAGATAYSGYKSSQAAAKQAEAAKQQAQAQQAEEVNEK